MRVAITLFRKIEFIVDEPDETFINRCGMQ